jgi:uncharacterized protein (DUF1778 family)
MAREDLIGIRLTPDERVLVERAARAAGVAYNEFMRNAWLEAAGAAKLGRCPLCDGKRPAVAVADSTNARLTEVEREAIETAADRANLTIAQFAREALLEAAGACPVCGSRR